MRLLLWRAISIIIYIVLGIGFLAAKDTPTEVNNSSPEMPSYVIVVEDGDEQISYHLPDSVYNRIAGSTVFVVNRTEINKNDPFLLELLRTVIPQANEREWMLVGIDLRGAASPEGPYNNNVRLSKGRAKALIDLMSERLDSVSLSKTSVTTVAEDYPRLLWMMEQAGDKDAPRVKAIIDKYTMDNPKAIKRELMKLDGSRLWSRLFLTYYPELRSARVVLFFKRINPKLPTTPAPLPEPELLPVDYTAIGAPQLPDPPVFKSKERQHLLSIGTNLLYDAFYMPQYGWAPMPNIQLEYYPRSGNYTFLASFLFPYYHRWNKHKFFQIRDYHLEARRYFNPGKRHLGPYLGAYINNNIYGIGLSATKGWEGEGLGGAVKLGYVLPLGNGRWRMDMHVAVGAYSTRYDPYVWGNPIDGSIDGDYYYDYTGHPDDFHRRNHRFTWFGPTEIGVTITCDILHYRSKSK